MNGKKRLRRIWPGVLVLWVFMSVVGWASFPIEFSAESPLVIGDYVDWMRYDGEDVRPLEGKASILVDPERNEGEVVALLRSDEESGPIVVAEGISLLGEIRLVMDRFEGPLAFMSGGIVESSELYGDSQAMSPIFPEMEVALAGWGFLDLYVDGELLYSGLPAQFLVNDLVRRGPERDYQIVRDRDGVIYRSDLEDKSGFVYSSEKELHLLVEPESARLLGVESPPIVLHVNLRVASEVAQGLSSGEPAGGGGSSGGGSSGGGSDGEPSKGPKGNNGLGNGVDPQPPGNPPVNDGEGSVKPGKGKK